MTDFMALSSSFSGDSGSHEYLYDVFLSFRGGDTRKNFVDHVYAALEKEGFLIFRDGDELERGEDIKSELMRAIRKSRCSIVVFSEGYASSRWCLDELVMILECKRKFDQFVFPVFYGVDPSHVRDQKGSVAEAFDRHVKSQPLDKVKRWKSALTEAANISGMVMLNQADWNASKFIEDLINFPPETSATDDLMTLTSSSSSNSRSQYLYDVFLSFRGEDTRENFVDHLYAALKKEGLLTFRDDNELERGEDVEPRLLRTIRKSRCSIVVFSEGYASSRWCLDELVMILECKRTFDQFVLPVFCGVDPSDVRKQTESIAKAFARHEKGQPLDKVKVWRAALTEAANIGGTMHERKFIKNLVAATTEILQSLLIRLCPVELNGFFEELPKGLKWSRWFEFPLNSIPDGLTLDRLVVLEARYSSWRQVWKGRKYLPSLKILDVCHSHNLTEVPDLSLVPNLEKLILNNCKNLVGIHGSIGKLERLVYLNIKGCKRIRKFPKHMPENLETIITHGCSNLEEFRIMQSKMMMHLKALDADEAHISGLVYGAHKSGRTFWDWFNKNTKLIVHVNIPHLLRGCEKFMKLIIQQYHAAANNQKLKWLNHKDSGVQNLKLIPSVTVSLHKLSKVADSYSAGTTYREVISCQGSKIVEDVNLEEKAGCEIEVADVEDEGLTESLKSSLFLYCSLFPLDYEFRKYELVQLWIAEGFIGEMHRERMEDTGILYFDFMESEGFFVPSRSDFSVDFDSVFSLPIYNPSNFLYKINTIKLSVLEKKIYQDGYFRAVDGKLDGASEMTQHLSLIFKNMDEVGCGVLQKFKHLRTLLLFNGSRSSIKQVPRNLLSGLKLLRTLNLSGTLISELPSSIRNVKALRYLDVSHTPIRQLPEAIDSLHNLQTIKLRGCVNFVQLPKGIKKLTNLRHVELDIIRQLDSLPAYLGNLTNLQTLSAFLVGRDPGCNIGELKNLNHLKGALRISRLENVLTKEEAEKASLSTKKSLQRVVLRWSSLLVENVREKEILECLQPHYGLQELGIQNYSGSTLPAWISNRAFADLLVVTLYRCKNCKRLPSLGQLPALKFLSIIEMNEVEEIHHHLFRNDGVAQEDPAFPKLERLEIDIMLNLKEWMAIKQGDLPSLLKLTVDSCPELVTLPSLSELKSLKHLEFRHCPKLLPLSQDGLPTSLESLVIICCPQLKEWCTKRGGQDQDNLSHVPRVWLDHEELKMQGEQSFSDA
ncbi:unnamed protein product [Malus baccata var. baccata]